MGALSERVLRARLQSLDHAYRVCRLCCHDACDDCPIDAELRQRAVEDAWFSGSGGHLFGGHRRGRCLDGFGMGTPPGTNDAHVGGLAERLARH